MCDRLLIAGSPNKSRKHTQKNKPKNKSCFKGVVERLFSSLEYLISRDLLGSLLDFELSRISAVAHYKLTLSASLPHLTCYKLENIVIKCFT